MHDFKRTIISPSIQVFEGETHDAADHAEVLITFDATKICAAYVKLLVLIASAAGVTTVQNIEVGVQYTPLGGIIVQGIQGTTPGTPPTFSLDATGPVLSLIITGDGNRCVWLYSIQYTAISV